MLKQHRCDSISPKGDRKDTPTLSSTCRSRAIDSLGMISLRPRREMKHRAWYWFCPRSNSPRIRARKIFTSCRTHGISVLNRTRSGAKYRPTVQDCRLAENTVFHFILCVSQGTFTDSLNNLSREVQRRSSKSLLRLQRGLLFTYLQAWAALLLSCSAYFRLSN